MKRQHILSFAALAAATVLGTGALKAQLHVDANGNVGVGTTTPSAQLHVNKTGTTTTYTGYFLNDAGASTGYKYGLYNFVNSNGGTGRYGILNYTYEPSTATTSSIFGLYNVAYGSNGGVYGHYNYSYQPSTATGTGYGQYNYLYTGTNSTSYSEYNYMYSGSGSGTRYASYNYVQPSGTGVHYGVYANTSGAGNYAGYFDGNVTVVGTFTTISDSRTKENLANVNGALAIVNRLQAKSYDYKKDVGMNLPEGQQYGFVAQELEQVLPSLVVTSSHPNAKPHAETPLKPGETPKEGLEASHDPELTTLKSVNYIGLIPILTEAIKEQQAQIDALRKELENR